MVKYRIVKKKPRGKWIEMIELWNFLKSLKFKVLIIGQELIIIFNILYKYITTKRIEPYEINRIKEFSKLLDDESYVKFKEYLEKIGLKNII